MPAISYRCCLDTQAFAFFSEYQGRTVIVGGPDQTVAQYRFSAGTEIVDPSTPELYYAHNVMPVSEGYQTVDYTNKCAGPTSFTALLFGKIPFVYNWYDGPIILDLLVAGQQLWARHQNDNTWTVLSSLTGDNTTWPDQGRPFFTKATVNGVTYGMEIIPSVGINRRKFHYIAGTIFNQTYALTGAPLTTDIRGNCAVSGYHIIWTEVGVFWSSSVDATDFTPSLVTGAGGGQLQQAKGTIMFIAPATFGAVIYTVANAVAMIFTANGAFPFTFQEIKGAGGYVSDQLIASDANSVVQLAYTTFGLQALSSTQAQGTLTQVSDFLSRDYMEDFSESTFLFTRTALSIPLYKKFTLVNGRFVVISYGATLDSGTTPLFSHALIYDLELKRYGKLKINHFDCYQWGSVLDPTMEQLIGALGFLTQDVNLGLGAVWTARIWNSTSVTGGVLLLGKYQYVRTRTMGLDQVTLENVFAAQTLRVSSLYSQDGKNTLEQVGILADSTGTQRRYVFDAVGMNHSILLVGAIDLSSMILDFHTHGRNGF